MSGAKPQSERELLSADEFAERFAESARVLWAVAAGVLGGASLADDVLQEAALIGFAKRSQLRVLREFRPWMARIVKLVAFNFLRRRKRELDLGGPIEGLEPTLPARADAAGMFNDEELDDSLRAALATLRPKARACLLLRVVLELEYTEIEATLGIKAATAMSHVHRARADLRRRLVEHSFGELRRSSE